jgi:hypothetical protein
LVNLSYYNTTLSSIILGLEELNRLVFTVTDELGTHRLTTLEVRLNACLSELDATPPGESDARLEEMRDEVSGRLAEVHANLVDMDAESGPARAAALLAGCRFTF